MDPNATLKAIRDLLEEGDSDEAGFMFLHLDDWLTNGGFLPTDWERTTQ